MTPFIEREALEKVFDRAARDASYRRKLIRNPHLGIKEVSGIWPSTMLRIKIVEKDPDVDVMIVLPDLEPDAIDEPPVVPAAHPAFADGRGAAAEAAACGLTEEDVCGAPVFPDRDALIRACASWAPPQGLVLEFGVFQGDSLKQLVAAFGPPVIGYDSFEGLPEDWERGPGRALPAGFFRCRPPAIDGAELVIGRFAETAARDLSSRRRPIRFAHIDSDLYASGVTALAAMKPWLQPGTVLLFDELIAFETSAYRNWREGEWRALAESGIACRPLGRTVHTQCALQVLRWE